MAEYYDVDRITNDQTGDVFHLKDYSLDKAVSSPAPIVSFHDGSQYPMSLQFAIEPVQSGSGDPSPENVRPISGFDGANLWVHGDNLEPDLTYESGKINNNTGAEEADSTVLRTGFVQLNNITSFMVANTSTRYIRFHYYGKNKNYLGNQLVTSPTSPVSNVIPNSYYVRIQHSNAFADIKLYAGHFYTITFPTSAGTVYGGTVTVNPDGTGELVVNKAVASYDKNTSFDWNYTNRWYHLGLPSGVDTTNANKTICNQAKYLAANNTYAPYFAFGSSGFYVNALQSGETIQEFKARLEANPLVFCYPLATPVTYHLTPGQVLSILGQNNVWADTGDIQSLSYVRNTVPELIRQDTAGQIASALDPVESSLAIVIDGDVAVGGLDSGKYVFLRSHGTLARGLYHTTAAIADGASITANNTEPDDEGGLNAIISNLNNLEGRLDGHNAGSHNSIYRGKHLGSSVSSAQWTAIKNGTFDDLFVGDYWTIDGVNWRIAGFNYWYNAGDTQCTKNHAVIVPDSNLVSCKMNSTNITTGAYVGSDFYTGNNSNTGKSTAISAVNNAFGSEHILSHREMLANATANGAPSAFTWCDSTVELMSEQMVYGSRAWGNQAGEGNGFDIGIGNSQLPLFRHDHSRIAINASWWLRSVVSASQFARIHRNGCAEINNASTSIGVRPVFGIYQS